jgi:glycosyltransferase involved in cell wall biosynthesis
MKILFIAPIPPPITGQSLAVQVFREAAAQVHEVTLINLAKNSFNAGLSSIGRVLSIFKIWVTVFRKHKVADRIYFTTSESVLGSLKDMVIFFICRRKLSSMYIHLHGGEGMKKILSTGNWLARTNIFFIKRLRGVIVLGKTQEAIYKCHIPANRIYTISNFALDEYFIPIEAVSKKFQYTDKIRVLYLSNLVHGKGYKELLAAYRLLDNETKLRIQLDFAGGFSSAQEERDFVEGLKGLPNVAFHGVVKGQVKQDLLRDAHVFCLPTYFPYEGQPISILEAYASGCCVVTTNHAGIFDIFEPGKNGFEVQKQSPQSIENCFRNMLSSFQAISAAGHYNNKFANQKFRQNIHLKLLTQLVVS